jgi:hypothetical protein
MDGDESKGRDEITDNVPYTVMEHHEDWLDPRDTGDPSRPQGWFWHLNERPGADEFHDVELDDGNISDRLEQPDVRDSNATRR